MSKNSNPDFRYYRDQGIESKKRIWTYLGYIRAVPYNRLVSEYFLHAFDILKTPATGTRPGVALKPGMTHQFYIWSLSPHKAIRFDCKTKPQNLEPFRPANHGYQFAAASNKEAGRQLDKLLVEITSGRLNPDPAKTDEWDKFVSELFVDNLTLKKQLTPEQLDVIKGA